jgi:hypothetical protein
MESLFTQLQSLPAWVPLVVSAVALLLALVCWIGAARTAGRVRRDSMSSAAAIERLAQHVDSFEPSVASKIREALGPVLERVSEGEREIGALKAQSGSLEVVIAEVRKDLERAAQKFEHFEEYFRSVFEKELRFAFRSFDETLGSVLKEMKGELLRGVNRIEQIQSVVGSRNRAEEQLTTSEAEVRRLLKGGATEPKSDKPESSPGGAPTPGDAPSQAGGTPA